MSPLSSSDVTRVKSTLSSSEYSLVLRLFETKDSLSMARLFAEWAVKESGLHGAELIWPDSMDQSPEASRIDRIGATSKANPHKVFSLRFKDENAIFFRINFFAKTKKPIAAKAKKKLQEMSRFVENLILAHEKRQHQEELNRFLWIRNLSAGLSHELNTPFTTLQFHIKKLGPQPNVEKPLQAITRVLTQYQKLSGDGTRAEPTPVTALAFAEGLKQKIKSHYPDHQQLIRFVSKGKPESALMREEDLHQVILALISNSLYALDERKAKDPNFDPSVEVRIETKKNKLSVVVTDNGSGIPTEDHPFVFAPFFSKKEVNQGMGMGLSLARAIAFMHDGTLSLNRLSKQTQFILEIPILEKELKRKAS